MLNLDETLITTSSYIKQRDLFKEFCLFIWCYYFVDILRAQVAEVNLLQLIPGFYLILLFISFFIFGFFFQFVELFTIY